MKVGGVLFVENAEAQDFVCEWYRVVMVDEGGRDSAV